MFACLEVVSYKSYQKYYTNITNILKGKNKPTSSGLNPQTHSSEEVFKANEGKLSGMFPYGRSNKK